MNVQLNISPENTTSTKCFRTATHDGLALHILEGTTSRFGNDPGGSSSKLPLVGHSETGL